MFCWVDIFVDPAKINSHRDSASRMREPNFMDLYNIIFYSTGIHSTGGCLIGWEIEAKKCLSLTVFEASEVTDLIYKSAVLSWSEQLDERIHQRVFWRIYGAVNDTKVRSYTYRTCSRNVIASSSTHTSDAQVNIF